MKDHCSLAKSRQYLLTEFILLQRMTQMQEPSRFADVVRHGLETFVKERGLQMSKPMENSFRRSFIYDVPDYSSIYCCDRCYFLPALMAAINSHSLTRLSVSLSSKWIKNGHITENTQSRNSDNFLTWMWNQHPLTESISTSMMTRLSFFLTPFHPFY